MRDMNVDAPEIHVESQGTGAPLVLLHGFAMNAGLFAPLLPALARQHRVHTVDIPGHGHSPAIEPFNLRSLAGIIDSAFDAHHVTVLGWSLGGQVALMWALLRPERVTRLVLVATTPSFVARDGWPHAMAAATLQRFGDELRMDYRLTLQRFLALQVQGSEAGRATLDVLRRRLFERGEPSPETLDAALGVLCTSDLREALPHIGVRTLVVAGDRDTLVPVAATRELASLLPHATHVTIEGAAHAPFLSHRQAFLDAVLSFVDA